MNRVNSISIKQCPRDERGRKVPKGVYLYRLDTPGFTDVNRAVLVR